MPRKANEKAAKAKELYLKGKKLVDIAKELEVPDGTVRRWKSTYKWDSSPQEVKKKENERSQKKSDKKTSVRKKPAKKKIKSFEQAMEETLENEELTDKQRLFCIYYVQSFNATQSYINAYDCDYNTGNTSSKRSVWQCSKRNRTLVLKSLKKK